ncbi:helix-turn-helix domain-containing protein [Roseibium algae]|uniref:Helix-turn-helix transcriptional regulator n=1 Tax=Roseibium algae TaxID=3123038 RepID=A0ABU8TLJ6_9HYPH
MNLPDLCDNRPFNAKLCKISQVTGGNNCALLVKDSSARRVHNLPMMTTTANAILSKWLDEAIGKAGTNQSQLARAVGLTSQKINRMVQGSRVMTAEELIRISQFLNAPIPSLSDAPDSDDLLLANADSDKKHLVKIGSDDQDFDHAYNRAWAAALEIESTEYNGDMPFEKFIEAVRIGLKAQLHGR